MSRLDTQFNKTIQLWGRVTIHSRKEVCHEILFSEGFSISKAESFLERDRKVAGLQEDLGPRDSVVSIDYFTSRIHSENK